MSKEVNDMFDNGKTVYWNRKIGKIMFMNYNSVNGTFNFLEMGQELLKPLQVISSGELRLIINLLEPELFFKF